MKYYINDQEVNLVTFRSHLHLSMEAVYGDKWAVPMKDEHIDFVIDNMVDSHQQVCINETCFLIE